MYEDLECDMEKRILSSDTLIFKLGKRLSAPSRGTEPEPLGSKARTNFLGISVGGQGSGTVLAVGCCGGRG